MRSSRKTRAVWRSPGHLPIDRGGVVGGSFASLWRPEPSRVFAEAEEIPLRFGRPQSPNASTRKRMKARTLGELARPAVVNA